MEIQYVMYLGMPINLELKYNHFDFLAKMDDFITPEVCPLLPSREDCPTAEVIPNVVKNAEFLAAAAKPPRGPQSRPNSQQNCNDQRKPSFEMLQKSREIYYGHDIDGINEFLRKRNPLSQYDCDFLCRDIPDPMWTSEFCLQRILTLLDRKELEGMKERILELWQLYLRKSPRGVQIEDLKELTTILKILNNKFSALYYADEIASLVFTHMKRGLRIKRLGEKLHLHALSSAFNDLGQLIYNGHLYIRQNLTQVLITWMDNFSGISNPASITSIETNKPIESCQNPKKLSNLTRTKARSEKLTAKSVLDLDQNLDLEKFIEGLEKSELPQAVLQLINVKGYNTLYVDNLYLLAKFANFSDKIRILSMKTPLINSILLKLSYPDVRSKILARSCEVILVLLGKSVVDLEQPPKDHGYIEPTVEAYHVLVTRFMSQMQEDSSRFLINLRNDTAFIIYLIIKNFPHLKSFEQISKEIAGIFSSNIMDLEDNPYMLESTIEDLELLLIFSLIIDQILDSKDGKKLIWEYELGLVFIRILIGPCQLLDVFQEDNSLYESLKSISWKVLCKIAHIAPKSLLRVDGVGSLLQFLDLYGNNSDLSLRHISIFLHVCRILLTQSKKGDCEEIFTYFKELDAMSTFNSVFEQFTKQKFDVEDEPALCNLLLCFAALGQYDEKQKDIFAQNEGVKELVRLIDVMGYAPAHKRHMNPFLHICVAECILQCVADNVSALEMFLAYEGVFGILDLLEFAAGPAAQLHILSCILELCDYPRCVDQLLFWKRRSTGKMSRLVPGSSFNLTEPNIPETIRPGDGDAIGEYICDRDRTLSALLCTLWRDEETRLGVLRDPDGIILSVERPLMSEFAREYKRELNHPRPSDWPGPSGLDMIASVRPKIYLIVKILTEATNTEATLFGGLTISNQLTMQIMVNFLDLKRGEIWSEIIDELRTEGFKLVESDEKALETFTKISRNKVSAVIDTQHYLYQRANEHEEMNEQEFYKLVQKSYLQDHLMALKEAEYLARTTNYSLLVDKRLWQKAQLQNSLLCFLSDQKDYQLHRAGNDISNITEWPGRRKIIHSEVCDTEVDLKAAKRQSESDIGSDATYSISSGTSSRQLTTTARSKQSGRPGQAMVDLENIDEILEALRRLKASVSDDQTSEENGKMDQDPKPRSEAVHNVTQVDEIETPQTDDGYDNNEGAPSGGHFTLNPYLLQRALEKTALDEKSWREKEDFAEGSQDELMRNNSWLIRKKWRKDWYPHNH